MSYRVIWHFPALRVFYSLPMHSATILDRAVIRFAEKGEGELDADPPHFRLRAGLHDALLAIDVHGHTLTVLRVYRMR